MEPCQSRPRKKRPRPARWLPPTSSGTVSSFDSYRGNITADGLGGGGRHGLTAQNFIERLTQIFFSRFGTALAERGVHIVDAAAIEHLPGGADQGRLRRDGGAGCVNQ